MPQDLPTLGDLERKVMKIIWSGGPFTADEVRQKLAKPLKESTVRTVLTRLEEKGYVTHSLSGRTFIYSAAESRERVAARAVKGIIDWFCNGSVEDVLVGMVDTDVLDGRELQRLAKKIGKANR